jgi:hypothetical protein
VIGVRYEGRFPPLGVTAQVAGRTLALARASGSPLSGTWTVATTLPAGTWPVTFAAAVDRGNAPVLAGPTITVTGPALSATAAPSAPSGTNKPGSESRDTEPAVPTSAPGEGPVAAPAPGADEGPPAASAAGEPGPASSGASEPATANSSPTLHEDAGTDAPASPAPPTHSTARGGTAGEAGVAPAPSGAEVDAVPVSQERSEGADAAHGEGDGMLVGVLLIGVAGVAGIALIGSALLLFGRRRSDPTEEQLAAAAADTAAALERRTIRRSKVRLADDPIVAAMGIGERPARRARRRAGHVGEGPGERPESAPPT